MSHRLRILLDGVPVHVAQREQCRFYEEDYSAISTGCEVLLRGDLQNEQMIGGLRIVNPCLSEVGIV